MSCSTRRENRSPDPACPAKLVSQLDIKETLHTHIKFSDIVMTQE